MGYWLKKSLLLLLLSFGGCATLTQELEPEVFYKRDIGIEVNGKEYEGVVVVPWADKYEFLLKPKGKLDLVLIKSCHIDHSGEKTSSGFLGIGGGQFKKTWVPDPKIESLKEGCVLRIDVYESKKGRHSWAFIAREHPEISKKYTLRCNGRVTLANGVGVCQGRAGTEQMLEFDEPVQWAPGDSVDGYEKTDYVPEECPMPIGRNGQYRFYPVLGECVYHAITTSGELARLYVIGYEGVLIREEQ